VGERDEQELATQDDRPRSDEDEREGPDGLGDNLARGRDRQFPPPARRIDEAY
jgi:hypothetical protein